MPRVQLSAISPDERRRLLDELWSMIALLENIDEVRAFFRDLLSETEAIMLARRIRIARHLLSGDSYDEIQRLTHAGVATIASVQRWLEGGNGGYTRVLPRLEKELERRSIVATKREAAKDRLSIEWWKRKYPLHFALFNLIDAHKLKTPQRLRRGRK